MASPFETEVEATFGRVLSAYGFRRVGSTPFCVRFENEDVFVNVRYDEARSFELDVEIGQTNTLFGGSERPFNIGEVLRLRGAEAKEEYDFICAETPSGLRPALDRLSRLLITYGGDLLSNDLRAFEALSRLRNEEAKAYAAEGRLRTMRARALDAWAKKDYVRFVKLFEPQKHLLTPEETNRLEHAKRLLRQRS
jgi:hypothetical protein